MAEPCPLIDLSGPPEERGRSCGRQAAGRIRRGIGHYGEQLRRLELGAGDVAALVRDYLPVIERFDETCVAEMRRKVLEQEHVALAMRAVYCTPRSASNNLMVGRAGGIAPDFECAPDETFLVHPDAGLLVHANHWQSPAALTRLRDTGIAGTPDSLYRDVRVRDLLRPDLGRLTAEHVKAALLDDLAAPWSACRPPRLNTGNTLSATVAMIVMQPGDGVTEVAMLPALDRRLTRYGPD